MSDSDRKYKRSEKARESRRRQRRNLFNKIRTREWIASDKGKANARGRRKEKAAFVRAMKSIPCADCGGTFDPVCMDFDHRDSSTKIAPVAHMVHFGFDALRAEIAKCDVVCSNCHRLRTFRRRKHGELIAAKMASVDESTTEQLGLALPEPGCGRRAPE
jgi:hypothetical protein